MILAIQHIELRHPTRFSHIHLLKSINIPPLIFHTHLKKRAMEMRQTYARVKEETRDGSLNDIHDVVKAIPALQQKYRGLNLHINIAEFLKPTTGNVRFQQKWQVSAERESEREVRGCVCFFPRLLGPKDDKGTRDLGISCSFFSRYFRCLIFSLFFSIYGYTD